MRIVHFADLHLGIKQYGMPERQDDFLVATAYIFGRAIELKADVINLGGDIFHSLHPSANIVLFLRDLVKQAQDAGIRVVGVDGNHDNVESAWLKLVGVEPLAGGTTTIGDIVFAGINGGRASTIRADLDKLVGSGIAKLDVLCMHLPLAEMAGFEGVEMSCREIADKVAPLGCRVCLLGDIHDYKETVIGGVRFIYSGSVEMTAKDENENKTFSIIDITKDSMQTTVEQIPIRPMLHYHIQNEEALDTLLADIEAHTADPRRKPLVLVTYEASEVGVRRKAELVLRGKALFRIMPTVSMTGDIFGSIVDKTKYERKGAMRNLREIVAERFGEQSPEFPLIIACIEKPDEVDRIALGYAKSEGLAIQ